MVGNLPAIQETQVQSLGQEDSLEKETATHSSILDWEIPWTEEPGRLQSMGAQSSVHGIFQARVLEWGAITFSVGELRECANRGRNTWFPAPRSPSALTRGPHPSAAPTGCRSLGPSMGCSRQEYWSGLPFPSPGNLPDPGIEPRSPSL